MTMGSNDLKPCPLRCGGAVSNANSEEHPEGVMWCSGKDCGMNPVNGGPVLPRGIWQVLPRRCVRSETLDDVIESLKGIATNMDDWGNGLKTPSGEADADKAISKWRDEITVIVSGLSSGKTHVDEVWVVEFTTDGVFGVHASEESAEQHTSECNHARMVRCHVLGTPAQPKREVLGNELANTFDRLQREIDERNCLTIPCDDCKERDQWEELNAKLSLSKRSCRDILLMYHAAMDLGNNSPLYRALEECHDALERMWGKKEEYNTEAQDVWEGVKVFRKKIRTIAKKRVADVQVKRDEADATITERDERIGELRAGNNRLADLCDSVLNEISAEREVNAELRDDVADHKAELERLAHCLMGANGETIEARDEVERLGKGLRAFGYHSGGDCPIQSNVGKRARALLDKFLSPLDED